MIRRRELIRRLSALRHIPDERDRSRGVVERLVAPGPDGRVVDRSVEREVDLHVPLEVVHDRAPAADALGVLHRGMIRHVVRQHVPVTGWGLGMRAVCPVLGDDTLEVRTVHHVGRVRRPRHGIHGVTDAIICARRVVAPRAGGDVDQHLLPDIQMAAQPDELDHSRFHGLVAGSCEVRRGTRIEEEFGGGISIFRSEREGGHAAPADADEFLDERADRDVVLGYEVIEGERLPPVRVDDAPGARQLEDQRRVRGGVAGPVGIAATVTLVGAVPFAVTNHRVGDPVSQRRG